MTREEALEILDTIPTIGEQVDALEIAIEALQADTVEVVWCKDCRHANECHKSVQHTRNEANTVTIGYSPIEWCSRGERSEE